MNYLFIQLYNIDIPEERFDILSIGEGIDVEMYLESPAHLLTYKGEEMTGVVEQSSIREDLGNYGFDKKTDDRCLDGYRTTRMGIRK